MAGLYSQQYMRAINFALGQEGVLSLDREDDGNWTGGVVGKGDLKGTKWGLSAAAYPQLDIASISRESAVAIYYRDYWCKIQGDLLPPRLSICVLDSAINQGVETAVKLLQAALKVTPVDGAMGPDTASAAKRVEQDDAIVAFLGERAFRYAQSKKLPTYGRGWMKRCMAVCQEASR